MTADWPNITGGDANKIAMDVACGVTPEQSTRLVYGPEEKAFWKEVKKQHEAMGGGPLHVGE